MHPRLQRPCGLEYTQENFHDLTLPLPLPPSSLPHSLTPQNGLQWMGVMTLCITSLLFTINFPMWGGMLSGPKAGVTEEDYYLHEWSAEEVSAGLHNPSMKFAMESKSQRGFKARVPVVASTEVSVKPDIVA